MLRRQSHQLDTLLQALPAAVYTTDAEGRITFFNEAAAALWGVRPELGSDRFCGSWKLYWPDGTPLPHDECPMAMALKSRTPIRGKQARSEEHTSELQSLMRISYAVFCLKKKKTQTKQLTT